MAARFWVGGTGEWNPTDTTHWSATSNGAGGETVPGSGDTVTFDASSGGGTVTLNFGGTITLQSITMGAFTGTFDNSVNNNPITLSATGGFSGSGSGVRTIKLGTATYTLTNNAATWNFGTITNLTLFGTTANIVFTGSSGTRTFVVNGSSHGNLTIGASSGSGHFVFTNTTTLASLSITAPNYVLFSAGFTYTVTAAFAIAGSSTSQIGFDKDVTGASVPTIAAAAGSTAAWVAFRGITFTGAPLATNSFDLGQNSGITITAPNGGSGAHVVGS